MTATLSLDPTMRLLGSPHAAAGKLVRHARDLVAGDHPRAAGDLARLLDELAFVADDLVARQHADQVRPEKLRRLTRSLKDEGLAGAAESVALAAVLLCTMAPPARRGDDVAA